MGNRALLSPSPQPSPKEREPHSPYPGRNDVDRARTGDGSPSPWGEGWGEGELDRRQTTGLRVGSLTYPLKTSRNQRPPQFHRLRFQILIWRSAHSLAAVDAGLSVVCGRGPGCKPA